MKADRLVVLEGGVRETALVRGSGMCVGDMPFDAGRRVLEQIGDRFGSVLEPWAERLYVQSGWVPGSVIAGGLGFEVLRDRSEYRGSAGALRDALFSRGGGLTLVVSSSRWSVFDAERALAGHARSGAGVSVLCDGDGEPLDAMVLDSSVVGSVPAVGYVDLKEQMLSRWVRGGVGVRGDCCGRGVPRVHDRASYLRCVREVCGSLPARSGGFVGEHRGCEGVVCVGASVAESALVKESVVMPGASVGDGAVVVGSVVCSGCEVESGSWMVDVVASVGTGPSRRGAGGALFPGGWDRESKRGEVAGVIERHAPARQERH